MDTEVNAAVFGHIHLYPCVQPGDFVSMTNVHAMLHKSPDPDAVDPVIPMVELCIHGGGAKYCRGLTVVDDSMPAVQTLKLVLSECHDDDDDDRLGMVLATSMLFVINSNDIYASTHVYR